jgi:ABC-type antimicrobial peptide transport system, permease component
VGLTLVVALLVTLVVLRLAVLLLVVAIALVRAVGLLVRLLLRLGLLLGLGLGLGLLGRVAVALMAVALPLMAVRVVALALVPVLPVLALVPVRLAVALVAVLPALAAVRRVLALVDRRHAQRPGRVVHDGRGGPGVGLGLDGLLELLGRVLLGLRTGAQELDHDRDHRDEHDQDQDQLDVLVHELDLAEPGTEQRDARAPHHAADDVEGEEGAVLHAADAGDDRRERAHDGHEAGQHQGLRPVLLEELVGLDHVLLLEQAGVRAGEERGPDLLAEEVARLVAEDRGETDQRDRGPQREVHGVRGDQQTAGEQQRVTRQEETDEQAGLGEDDQQQAPYAEVVQERVRIQPAGTEGKRHHGSGLLRVKGGAAVLYGRPKLSTQCVHARFHP